MRGAAFFLPAILVLLIAPFPQAQGTQPPPTSPLTLLSRDGRRIIPTTVSNGRELVALDDVASILQITVREDTVAGGVTVAYKGRNVLVSTTQPLASVEGRAVSLSAPATRVGNRWSVATDFFPSALGLIYDGRIELRRAARLLLVGDVSVPRVTARIDSAGSSTRATIDIAPATRASVVTEPGRLVIRLEADALETVFPRDGSGLIEEIRLGDQPTTIAVVLAGRAGQARAVPSEIDGLTRIEIDVAPQVLTPETAALPAAPTAAAPPPMEARSPLGTIVIDPGHGGDDIGVRGSKGSQEKSLTLTIAQRLRAMIETRLGIRVILTRNDDRRVNLDERAAIANNNKADLFLSLHLNAAPVAAGAGAEVIHLRLDREGEDARRAAEGESVVLPVFSGTTRTVDVIRWDLAQARHAEASAAFAGMLEEQLRTRVAMGALPRRELPLRLLTSVNMPAAMVEMAYLSNAGQEQLVRSEAYQVRLAQAMADAVLQFRSYLEERETR